ncbi:MAG: cyclic pyranopterin monophosphate synthase MoaC [Polyangiaceae bacterium]
MPIVLYNFEGPLDLAVLDRPPLAALRALRITGVLLTRAGWTATPHGARLDLSLLGSQPKVENEKVVEALSTTPPREVKMFQRQLDPDPDSVPEDVQRALGPGQALSLELWRSLTSLDRHVLIMLRANTRLLWRALDEISAKQGGPFRLGLQQAWTGELARAEVRMRPKTAQRLQSPSFRGGLTLVLARTAGLRAARRAGELMDEHSHVTTGAVELGFRIDYDENPAKVLCQAHVSSVQGEFFAAGSLLAATTAAATLVDLAREEDAGVMIEGARLAQEPWLAEGDDEVTLWT